MGAGSVIGAMAGIQDIDRMGGFRKAMPFTFITFAIGALALSGFPLTAGFFSKDEVLAFTLNRGGGLVVLALVRLPGGRAHRLLRLPAWSSASSSASRCPRRASWRAATLAHGEPMNPATGETEDTDVGFPGPEHHVAERAWPMKFAMVPLALLSLIAGVLGVPGLTDTLEHFLEPTFEDSRYLDTIPARARSGPGWPAGGRRRAVAIALAYVFYVRRPGRHAAAARPLRDACTAFLVNKWYFDELYRRGLRAADGHRRQLRPPGDRDRLRAGHDRGRGHRRSCAWAPRWRARSRPASCAPTR